MPKTTRCPHLAPVTAALTVLASIVVSGVVFHVCDQIATGTEETERPSIHLVMDSLRLNHCPGKVRDDQLPCLTSANRFYTKNDMKLGPMACQDECDWIPTALSSDIGTCAKRRCHANTQTFQVVPGASEVRIGRAGVYLMYAQVTYGDYEKTPAMAALCVNNHSWSQCLQSGSSRTSPSTVCSLSSARRFKPGDYVSVYIPEAHRTINSSHLVTYWGLVRVHD